MSNQFRRNAEDDFAFEEEDELPFLVFEEAEGLPFLTFAPAAELLVLAFAPPDELPVLAIAATDGLPPFAVDGEEALPCFPPWGGRVFRFFLLEFLLGAVGQKPFVEVFMPKIGQKGWSDLISLQPLQIIRLTVALAASGLSVFVLVFLLLVPW